MNYEAKYELVKYACSRQSQEEAGMEKQATPLGVAFAGMEAYNAYKHFRKGNWWRGLGRLALGGVSLIPGAGIIRGGLMAGKLGRAGMAAAKGMRRTGHAIKGMGKGKDAWKLRAAAARQRFSNLSHTQQKAIGQRRWDQGWQSLRRKTLGRGNRMQTAVSAGAGIAAGGWANALLGQGQQGQYGPQYAGGYGGYGGGGGRFNMNVGTTGNYAKDKEGITLTRPGSPQSPAPQPRFASRYS